MADIVEVDVATGKQVIRPLNAPEQAQRDADIAAAKQREADNAAKPDPLVELLTAIDSASTVPALKTALRTHLPRAFGAPS